MQKFLSVAEAHGLFGDIPVTAESNCCVVNINNCRCICEQISKRICVNSIECIQKCTVHLNHVKYEQCAISVWYDILLYYVDYCGRTRKIRESDSMVFTPLPITFSDSNCFQVYIPKSNCASICCDEVLIGFFVKLCW